MKPAQEIRPPRGEEFFRSIIMDGGPGTANPTRIDYRGVSLAGLVAKAYGLKDWQYTGPTWIDDVKFDIAARVPAGSTKEQFESMLQNLLAERLKLQVHRETREMDVYAITLAKGGSKLRPHVTAPSPDAQPQSDGPPRKIETDRDGYPILTSRMTMASANGRARLGIRNEKLTWLVNQLSSQLSAPVVDETGLANAYDFDLYWQYKGAVTERSEAGPDLIEAVREQLGLKLEKKKGPVQVLVIDHAEKTPSTN